MAKTIGIDLGTTNSCVAVMENGNPTVILNTEGQRTTPSIVAYTDKGERLVGQIAKNQTITNPANTIRSIKRFMGRRYKEVESEIKTVPYQIIQSKNDAVRVKVKDTEYSPEEISARILQKMKEAAENYLGEEVKSAVITVPAYFNDSQRQATKDAGKIAGLEVKRIVNEPTAAALAYGMDKKNEEKIAVYDLGGGTFDISILEVGGDVVQVLSTNGDTHLGGDDFDQRIVNWLIDEFKKQSGIDLSEDKMALQRLKEAAEKAKIELSQATNADINLPFITADQNGPKHLNLSLTRAKFEDMISDLLDRTKKPCEKALSDARLSASDIDEVILVGGSTRVPKVGDIVKEIFGKEGNKSVNPDEVVAMGAAVQAGVLSGDVKDVLLLDVTPLSLGLETLGGVFTKIIERNTTIPTKKSQIFSTAADNQTAVTIKVYQGEREVAAYHRLLGNFDLVGIPPAPRGVPQIEVTFNIDANGILQVTAKDKGTGKEQSIKITGSSSLSDDEIDKMVKDAKEHAEEDKKIKELADEKNKLDSFVLQLEKLLKENANIVPESDKKNIEDKLAAAKKALESNDINVIKNATKDLEEASHTFSQKLYEQQQAASSGQAQGAGKTGDTSSSNTTANENSGKKDDDVVDADFKVED